MKNGFHNTTTVIKSYKITKITNISFHTLLASESQNDAKKANITKTHNNVITNNVMFVHMARQTTLFSTWHLLYQVTQS